MFLQARGSFISKSFIPNQQNIMKQIKQTYFLFSNGEAGLTLETDLSAHFKTRVTLTAIASFLMIPLLGSQKQTGHKGFTISETV